MAQLQKDLTKGSVTKQLLLFSVPFLFANLLQAVYSMADMVIVGRYTGPTGIAAVQVGGQVMLILTNMIAGLAMGATVVIGQFQGAGRERDQKETIGTLMTLFALIGAGVTIMMFFLTNPVLRLLRTPQEAFSDARSYLLICSGGCLFLFGYHAISAVLRGMGDSIRPLYFIAIAAVFNVGLDFLFVGLFDLRAAGAAWATVISQAISFLSAVLYLRKKKFVFDFKLSSFRLYRGKSALIFKIGLPTTVQFSITGLSFLTLTGLANQIAGVTGSTVLGIGSRINSFGVLPCQAMCAAISAMAAQNIGAGQPDRAKKATFLGAGFALVVSATVFFAVFFFPQGILRFFLSSTSSGTQDSVAQEVLSIGPKYLFWVGFDYLFAAVFFSANGLATGSGHTWFAMINSAINALVFRIPAAFLLTSVWNLGMMGLAYAIGLTPVVSAIIGLWYVLSNRWKKPRLSPVSSSSASGKA